MKDHRRTALVAGAGGFIGGHLVKHLKHEGYYVRGVDIKMADFAPSAADEFVLADLRDMRSVHEVVDRRFDEVYQLAADMGGAGYVFTGEHDADVMHNSALINLHMADICRVKGAGILFFPSSACIYPAYNQNDPADPRCGEDSAYPANPDSDYGWEKLFSERLYFAFHRNHGLNIRVGRLHNVYGPEGAWEGGKEKAPAAICRKVAETEEGGTIEIWGDGRQTRSFLYIDECLEGIRRLVTSSFTGPVNIGSAEMVTIDQLATMIIEISGKSISVRYGEGPTGVRGRTSDNRLIRQRLGWVPTAPLRIGMEQTYRWIAQQVANRRS